VLAPDSTLDAPKFVKCGPRQRPAVVLDIDETALMNLGYEADDSQRNGPYDQKRWDRWEASGITAVEAVPGAVETLRAARAAGIEVVFNSNRNSVNAQATIDALTLAGLGPVVHFQNLWLKGDDATGSSGKDARRWEISGKYCVIAMVGDQLGDFSDQFNAANLSPAQRRALTNSPKLRVLWGHGWFVLPNPVYGTALKGNIDDVFPKDRRWTDPGAQPMSAALPPAAAPAPEPVAAPAAAPVKK
jgi:5'-nucleotidase (lipoprotein e(P4) family)